MSENELSDLRECKKRYEACFVRIAKAYGIESPLALIAMAENDDENFAEILTRHIESCQRKTGGARR